MQKTSIASLYLRIGIAVAFIYPAISAWFAPYLWIGYFPEWVFNVFPTMAPVVILHLFGTLEIIIGLWILIGKKLYIPCFIALGLLTAIIVCNIHQFDVLFRDVSILFMICALLSIDISTDRDLSAHTPQ